MVLERGRTWSAIPLTSAPAEKKRPSPVRTVKTVFGWSFRARSAAMVELIREPPKEFRDLGRLNCGGLDGVEGMGRKKVESTFMMPI